jgi:hypothetical protein
LVSDLDDRRDSLEGKHVICLYLFVLHFFFWLGHDILHAVKLDRGYRCYKICVKIANIVF